MHKNNWFVVIFSVMMLLSYALGVTLSGQVGTFVLFLCAAISSLITIFLSVFRMIYLIQEKEGSLLKMFLNITCSILGVVFIVPSWIAALGSIELLNFYVPVSIQIVIYLLIIFFPFAIAAFSFSKFYELSERARKKRTVSS